MSSPRPTRFTSTGALVLTLLITLFGCGSAESPRPSTSSASRVPSARPFEPARITLTLDAVTDIPGAPLGVVASGDGTGRLFVVDQGGLIWTVQDGKRADEAFLDVSDEVTAGGERGLLGLAFHPTFPDDPRFFIYYSTRDSRQVVAERRLDPANPGRADPRYERVMLSVDDFASNHNGGAVVFGPDRYLYIATGDGGGGGDPEGNGQRLDTLLAKILRIDVPASEGRGEYAVPADNPFVGRDGARPEIWHTGLRNPWRFSFDRAQGDMWIGDVGQGAWEEIDVARRGASGLNFGWSIREGRHCYRGESCSRDGLTEPVTEYSHDLGCSVTGGVVYRGSRWPALVGSYLFADYCSGRVWAIDATKDQVEEPVVVAESERSISSFGEDEAGEVYVTDLGGMLLRLGAAG
jgi:glucose/arabinose dehydrogenase